MLHYTGDVVQHSYLSLNLAFNTKHFIKVTIYLYVHRLQIYAFLLAAALHDCVTGSNQGGFDAEDSIVFVFFNLKAVRTFLTNNKAEFDNLSTFYTKQH